MTEMVGIYFFITETWKTNTQAVIMFDKNFFSWTLKKNSWIAVNNLFNEILYTKQRYFQLKYQPGWTDWLNLTGLVYHLGRHIYHL